MEPADFCRRLLATIDASDGRRSRRKRDTTPDSIGLELKRQILECAIEERPGRGDFEDWLWLRGSAWAWRDDRGEGHGSGAINAMAASILSEWRLCGESAEFRAWLMAGAPSADAKGEEHQDNVSAGPDHS